MSFTVKVEYVSDDGELQWSKERTYYDRFDALTVAEIEHRDYLRVEGTIPANSTDPKFFYYVDFPEEAAAYLRVFVEDDNTGEKVPLRRAEV